MDWKWNIFVLLNFNWVKMRRCIGICITGFTLNYTLHLYVDMLNQLHYRNFIHYLRLLFRAKRYENFRQKFTEKLRNRIFRPTHLFNVAPILFSNQNLRNLRKRTTLIANVQKCSPNQRYWLKAIRLGQLKRKLESRKLLIYSGDAHH